jgi:hypothetical protein
MAAGTSDNPIGLAVFCDNRGRRIPKCLNGRDDAGHKLVPGYNLEIDVAILSLNIRPRSSYTLM